MRGARYGVPNRLSMPSGKRAGGREGDASLPDVGTDAYESSDGRSFVQWFQIGVALTLPLIIFGAVALALFVWMASK